jgi:hypothetical protein
MTNIPIRIPADEPAPAEPQDIYYGLSFSVDQILILVNGLTIHAREMKAAFDQHSMVPLKVACDEIARHAGQAANLSRHLSHVLTQHIARKPRP